MHCGPARLSSALRYNCSVRFSSAFRAALRAWPWSEKESEHEIGGFWLWLLGRVKAFRRTIWVMCSTLPCREEGDQILWPVISSLRPRPMVQLVRWRPCDSELQHPPTTVPTNLINLWTVRRLYLLSWLIMQVVLKRDETSTDEFH